MNPDHRILAAVLLVAASAASGQATVDGMTAPQARSLAASCGACHGTDGHAVDGEAMVALAGYPRESLVTQMRAFRDGTRGPTVMQQIARGYTDRQVESLAAWFATQTPRSR